MNLINTVLGTPLGFIIHTAFRILGSYGLSIVAFAIIVKIVLFPVMLLAHRNSIRLLQLQPALNIIKQRHAGDKDSLNEAQYELFAKEKYSPLVGILPLLIQLFLVVGMLQVMYHPLQHILRMDSVSIDLLVEELGITGFAPQLQVLEVMPLLDLQFLGLNLGITPSLTNPGIELIIVLLAGLIAFTFCLVQNAISPGALSQSRRTNIGLTIFTVGLSVYFALALPVGVGLYWTVGNFTAIGVVLLLNVLYPPKKLAAESIAHLQTIRKSPEEIRNERKLNQELKKRSNLDSARFKAAQKQLVFYAISGGQYKFYKTIIDYLLENSDIIIHYLTNDPNDAVFSMQQSKLIPYYATQQKTISLMLQLDTDIMVTTVPDLQIYHMKRSIVRDDIEYIYVLHGLGSMHLAERETAHDHFDTVFCVGPHQIAELRRREELANVPKKNLVKVGYGLYDQLIEAYGLHTINEKPRILIAPSWQKDNILESCIESMIEALHDKGYCLIIRPHPQHVRIFPKEIHTLQSKYSNSKDIIFDLDFSDIQSIFQSDLLITDWSNIAFEFSYCTLKPCLFINTPIKIMNPTYEQYGIVPLEILLRDKIGVSIDQSDMPKLYETVNRLFMEKDIFRESIREIVTQYLFHPSRSGEAGGKYIIKKLELKNPTERMIHEDK